MRSRVLGKCNTHTRLAAKRELRAELVLYAAELSFAAAWSLKFCRESDIVPQSRVREGPRVRQAL